MSAGSVHADAVERIGSTSNDDTWFGRGLDWLRHRGDVDTHDVVSGAVEGAPKCWPHPVERATHAGVRHLELLERDVIQLLRHREQRSVAFAADTIDDLLRAQADGGVSVEGSREECFALVDRQVADGATETEARRVGGSAFWR
jgi:hypothetical protein